MGQVVGKEEEGAKVVRTGIDQLLASNFGPLRNGKVLQNLVDLLCPTFLNETLRFH